LASFLFHQHLINFGRLSSHRGVISAFGTRSFKRTHDPVETGSHASALDVLISVAQLTVRAHN
jgi:hypothetical protein